MRCTLAALVLMVSPATSWSADRKGTLIEDCCNYTFHLHVLHKEKSPVQEKEIILSLHRGCPPYLPLDTWVGADWAKVEATICDEGSDQCEPATAAKIRLEFLSRNGRNASGTYSVDFSSTRREDGKFRVKLRKHPTLICE